MYCGWIFVVHPLQRMKSQGLNKLATINIVDSGILFFNWSQSKPGHQERMAEIVDVIYGR
jgi:hypothetical protein